MSLVPFCALECLILSSCATQTEILLKQQFRARWSPLDAYIMLIPLKYRLNPLQACLSDPVARSLMQVQKSLSATG